MGFSRNEINNQALKFSNSILNDSAGDFLFKHLVIRLMIALTTPPGYFNFFGFYRL
jgi:hypothetical protein